MIITGKKQSIPGTLPEELTPEILKEKHESIPKNTAINDLSEMVEYNIIKKVGKGRAVRYKLL